jgi:hypothetical protein
MLAICLALGIFSIKTVHAGNPRFVSIPIPSQSSTHIGGIQAVAAPANVGSAAHGLTLGWWDVLFVLLIIEAEAGLVVTHQIREKKTLIAIGGAILPSLYGRIRGVFGMFRKTEKRDQLGTIAFRILILAFIGGSLIFYAIGIASNFFALPIFKAFFFFSSETAHNTIAYLAALTGSLALLTCLVMARLHQDLCIGPTPKDADIEPRNKRRLFSQS